MAWTGKNRRVLRRYRLLDFDRDFGNGDSIDMQFRSSYSSLGLLV